MRARATTNAPADSGADTVAIGVFDGEDVAHDVSDGTLQQLLDSGEAKRRFKATALAHADGKRWIVAGLGDRAGFDAERARVAAATALGRARDLGTKALCWEVPHHVDDAVVGGLVEGTVLGAYRFTQFKSATPDDEDGIGELLLSAARTPIGKLGGGLAPLAASDLGGIAIEAALERADVAPDSVDHVVMGTVLQGGQGQIPSRQAQINAGIPKEVSS